MGTRPRIEVDPADTIPNVPAILAPIDVSDVVEQDGPRYAIVGSIHRGGMGEILLARVEGPEGFSRKVVLKGLLSKLSQDDVSYQLFMHEALLMSRLDHPNIVRVFDLPRVGGKPYLAMEYLRGRNFHQVIQRAASQGKTVPTKIALHVVAQALRGLHYAHSQKTDEGDLLGVIHRDVSPGNLLLSFFGEVKVTDFGIAKIANSPRFTGPRSIRGKARYVAPEQVHGEPATILSDIYSAGVVLAEALLGEPLWERKTVPETLLAIVSEDREKTIDRILRRHEDVPGLSAALRGSLALRPEDRFASALQFAETLESIARAIGGTLTDVELGLYVRALFVDAPDVPHDDGFGRSGFPVPKFEMLEEDTDSTIITLEPDWIKQHSIASTTRMRPTEPRVLPPPLPLTPSSRPTPDVRPNEPMADASLDVADTAIKAGTPGVIKASALPEQIAIFHDPAEPAREYSFSELPAYPTAPEAADSPLRRPARRMRSPLPRSESLATQRAMTFLLAGIFIGASLAIAGCVIALLAGP
jgi:serine/threonine protein kinase